MQMNSNTFSRHALERCSSRKIPPRIVELILEYGEPRQARDGAQKFALSRQSLCLLKQDFGREFSKVVGKYRDAYVVMCGGTVVTVVWANNSIVH